MTNNIVEAFPTRIGISKDPGWNQSYDGETSNVVTRGLSLTPILCITLVKTTRRGHRNYPGRHYQWIDKSWKRNMRRHRGMELGKRKYALTKIDLTSSRS